MPTSFLKLVQYFAVYMLLIVLQMIPLDAQLYYFHGLIKVPIVP